MVGSSGLLAMTPTINRAGNVRLEKVVARIRSVQAKVAPGSENDKMPLPSRDEEV
ncbi:hypothetical protein RSAG8_01255, partial [Rhizoctonia solani AG-8 WAC10335]